MEDTMTLRQHLGYALAAATIVLGCSITDARACQPDTGAADCYSPFPFQPSDNNAPGGVAHPTYGMLYPRNERPAGQQVQPTQYPRQQVQPQSLHTPITANCWVWHNHYRRWVWNSVTCQQVTWYPAPPLPVQYQTYPGQPSEPAGDYRRPDEDLSAHRARQQRECEEQAEKRRQLGLNSRVVWDNPNTCRAAGGHVERGKM
ncbi:MAG TPA: hypothetical protein VN495_03020 [Candidatus Paceibacterota bacterium]|nr:hypothetical protein [Candidatus Paceibacterota bacterium]